MGPFSHLEHLFGPSDADVVLLHEEVSALTQQLGHAQAHCPRGRFDAVSFPDAHQHLEHRVVFKLIGRH